MPNKSFKIVTGIILLIYLSLFNFNSINVIIAAERKINVEVDRILVNFDIQDSIIMGEITMVPLRNVF